MQINEMSKVRSLLVENQYNWENVCAIFFSSFTQSDPIYEIYMKMTANYIHHGGGFESGPQPWSLGMSCLKSWHVIKASELSVLKQWML